MADCVAFWPTEKMAAKMRNVTGDKFVGMLATYLRDNGDQVLSGTVKITLSDHWLRYLNSRLPQCEADDFTPGTFVPADRNEEDVAFIFEFLQMVEFVKIVHDKKARGASEGLVDVTRFRALKSIEIADVPVMRISGLASLRDRLESIAFCGPLVAMRDLFSKCGADNVSAVPSADANPESSSGVTWPRLSRAFLSGCGLAATDDSLRCVPSLSSMDLSHNKIKSVAEDFRLLVQMERLDMSYNAISSVLGINAMLGRVTWLSLKGNALTSVAGIDKLYSLEHLDVSSNCIDSFGDVARLGRLPLLTELHLQGNPISFHGKYRVLALTPFSERLDEVVLDGVPATPKERKAVAQAAALDQPATPPDPRRVDSPAPVVAAPLERSDSPLVLSSTVPQQGVKRPVATRRVSQPTAIPEVGVSSPATSVPATPVMETLDVSAASLVSAHAHVTPMADEVRPSLLDAGVASPPGAAAESPRVTALKTGKGSSTKKPKKRKVKEAVIHDAVDPAHPTVTNAGTQTPSFPVVTVATDAHVSSAPGSATVTPTAGSPAPGSPSMEPVQFASASSEEDNLGPPKALPGPAIALPRQGGQLGGLAPPDAKLRSDSTVEFQQRVAAMREEGGSRWLMILNGLEEKAAESQQQQRGGAHAVQFATSPSSLGSTSAGASSTQKKKGHGRQHSLAANVVLGSSPVSASTPTGDVPERKRSETVSTFDPFASPFGGPSENSSAYATPIAPSPGTSTDNLHGPSATHNAAAASSTQAPNSSGWNAVARAVKKKKTARPKSMPASAFKDIVDGADYSTTGGAALSNGEHKEGSTTPTSTRSPATGRRANGPVAVPRSRAGACSEGLVDAMLSSQDDGAMASAMSPSLSNDDSRLRTESGESEGGGTAALPPVREPTHEFFAEALVAGGHRATRILTVGNNAVVESDASTGRVVRSHDTRVLVEINDVFLTGSTSSASGSAALAEGVRQQQQSDKPLVRLTFRYGRQDVQIAEYALEDRQSRAELFELLRPVVAANKARLVVLGRVMCVACSHSFIDSDRDPRLPRSDTKCPKCGGSVVDVTEPRHEPDRADRMSMLLSNRISSQKIDLGSAEGIDLFSDERTRSSHSGGGGVREGLASTSPSGAAAKVGEPGTRCTIGELMARVAAGESDNMQWDATAAGLDQTTAIHINLKVISADNERISSHVRCSGIAIDRSGERDRERPYLAVLTTRSLYVFVEKRAHRQPLEEVLKVPPQKRLKLVATHALSELCFVDLGAARQSFRLEFTGGAAHVMLTRDPEKTALFVGALSAALAELSMDQQISLGAISHQPSPRIFRDIVREVLPAGGVAGRGHSRSEVDWTDVLQDGPKGAIDDDDPANSPIKSYHLVHQTLKNESSVPRTLVTTSERAFLCDEDFFWTDREARAMSNASDADSVRKGAPHFRLYADAAVIDRADMRRISIVFEAEDAGGATSEEEGGLGALHVTKRLGGLSILNRGAARERPKGRSPARWDIECDSARVAVDVAAVLGRLWREHFQIDLALVYGDVAGGAR